VALDGGEFFGTVPLSVAGSLSYEIYGGIIRPKEDGGAALEIRNSLPASGRLDAIDAAEEFGGQLWWNTPLDGLRFGVAGGLVPELNYIIALQLPGSSIRVDTRTRAAFEQYSAEYLWKAWTFQAEAYFRDYYSESGAPGTHLFTWYGSAAYRFNKWFEAGGYYTEYYGDLDQTGNSLMFQKDAALALRFDATASWTFKIEGHYLRGTGLLQNSAGNPAQNGNGWWMLDLKTTFSF